MLTTKVIDRLLWFMFGIYALAIVLYYALNPL